MRLGWLFVVAGIVFALVLAATPASAQLARPSAVPVQLDESVKSPLETERSGLDARWAELVASTSEHNQVCSRVSAREAEEMRTCPARQAALTSAVRAYLTALSTYEVRLGEAILELYVREMRSRAQTFGWSPDEQSRLENALRGLALDRAEVVMDLRRLSELWYEIRRRGGDAALIAAADTGRGPPLFSAGMQSNQDCAVYALAAASGAPYRAVAERAAEFIDEGRWRPYHERIDPAATVRAGLTGGEVVMLAEMLGQAEIVPPAGFADSLRQGRSVIVTVAVRARDAVALHSVVLSRTFRHGDEDWFEVIDSSRASQQQRLFVSASELDSMLMENGVAFRPDGDGRIPLSEDTG